MNEDTTPLEADETSKTTGDLLSDDYIASLGQEIEAMDFGHDIRPYFSEQLLERLETREEVAGKSLETITDLVEGQLKEERNHENGHDVTLMGEIVADFRYANPEDQADERTVNVFYPDAFKDAILKLLEALKS